MGQIWLRAPNVLTCAAEVKIWVENRWRVRRVLHFLCLSRFPLVLSILPSKTPDLTRLISDISFWNLSRHNGTQISVLPASAAPCTALLQLKQPLMGSHTSLFVHCFADAHAHARESRKHHTITAISGQSDQECFFVVFYQFVHML